METINYTNLDKDLTEMIKLHKGEFSFYLNNIEFLTDLSFAFYNNLNDLNIEKKDIGYVDKIDKRLIADLLFDHFSSRFFRTYYSLETSNRINVVNDKDFNSVCDKNGIEYVFDNTYSYIPTLIHELAHSTNIDYNNRKITPSILTEFISIYYETITKDILVDNYNINKNDIDFLSRLRMSKINNLEDIEILFPLLVKEKYGSVSKENIDKLKEEKNYLNNTEYNYETIFNSLYSALQFNALNKENFMKECIKMTYQKPLYLFSTCLAFYAVENLEKKEIDQLNEKIIDNPDENVIELLNSIGIKLDNNFINNSINSIKNYYNIKIENKITK